MKRLDDLILGLKELKTSIPKKIKEVIQANEGVILDMNTKNQLYEQGIDNRGIAIASYQEYTPFTIKVKQEKNQPTDRVTLRDEGDFYSGFYIEYTQDKFRIYSTDEKADKLGKKYGYQIFGLSDSNFTEIRDVYVKPEIMALFHNIKF